VAVTDRTVRVLLDMVTSSFTRGATAATTAARGVRGELGQLTTVAARNSQAFTTVGLAVGAAGTVMTLGLRSAANEAAMFESALTKSTTLIGISSEEMNRMGDAALRLSDTGQGPQDLADALFFVQSAGLRGSDAMAVVEASAQAASIGLGDTASIADLVTSAVNAYGSESLSASQATDILIGTVREGKAEASSLAGVMGRILPIAAEMGISFEEVGGALAAMTRTGSSAEEATTQLRSIMTSLLKPARESEEALTGIGLSSAHLRDVIAKDGLWAALQQLSGAIGDNDEALAQIFPNVRALAGFLDLTGKNAAANDQIFRNMTDTTGLLSEGFEEWSKTTEAAQKRFSASMEAARISLGESLQGPMKAVLNTGTGVAQMFTDLPDPMQKVAGIGGSIGAVALTMAGGFLVAAPRIAATKAAMADLAVTMPKTTRLMRGMGSVLMGPLGIALAAGVGLLTVYANEKAKARQITEAFIATLDAETGAVTENSREHVIKGLQQSGALDVAKKLGIANKDLTEAILGNADAEARVRAAIDEHSSAGNTLHTITGGLTTAFDDEASAADSLEALLDKAIGTTSEATAEGRELAEELAEQKGKWVDVEHAVASGMTVAEAQIALSEQQRAEQVEAEAELENLGGAYNDLEGEVDAATEALEAYLEQLKLATDPVFALNDALGNLEQTQRDGEDAVRELERAQEDLDEVRGDSEASARDLEDAEKKVEEAQRKVKESGWDVAEALSAVEQAALNGDLSFEDFSAKLDQWVESGALTEQQAEDIRERVKELTGEAENYEGDYDAEIKADRAQAKLQFNLASREADTWGNRKPTAQLKAKATGIPSANKDLNKVAAKKRTAKIKAQDTNTGSVSTRLNNAARDRTATIYARIRDETGGYLGRIHTGGVITPHGVRRYHDGGTVGSQRLASDERPAILQTGERVLSRGQNDNFEAMMRSLGRTASGGGRTTTPFGGGSVDVTLTITGSGSRAKDFHEAVRNKEIKLSVNGQPVRVG
jgi:TP901 family phage tail tape measure protein